MSPHPFYSSPQLHVNAMIGVFAGLWLGGLIALDLVETPAKFGIKGIERSAAVQLGQEVFHRFGRLEAAFALAMMVLAYHGVAPPFLMASSIVLSILALGVSPWLRRSLDRTMSGGIVPTDGPDYRAFRVFHRLYVAGDLAKMLLLALVFWRIAG